MGVVIMIALRFVAASHAAPQLCHSWAGIVFVVKTPVEWLTCRSFYGQYLIYHKHTLGLLSILTNVLLVLLPADWAKKT